MFLLVFVGGLVLGFVMCHAWGNHRAKYWRSKCEEIVEKAEAVHAANSQLKVVLKRMQQLERSESVKGMSIGLTEAIASMSKENA